MNGNMQGLILSLLIVGAMIGVIYLAFRGPGGGDVANPQRWPCPACHNLNELSAETCTCGTARPQAAVNAGTLDVAVVTAQPRAAGGSWSLWGWSLSAVGCVGMIVGAMMKTTVETFVPSGLLGGAETSEVVNLGLLFQKGVVLATSLASIGFGVFCIGIGAIIAAIARAQTP